jgi:hypothetical protein
LSSSKSPSLALFATKLELNKAHAKTNKSSKAKGRVPSCHFTTPTPSSLPTKVKTIIKFLYLGFKINANTLSAFLSSNFFKKGEKKTSKTPNTYLFKLEDNKSDSTLIITTFSIKPSTNSFVSASFLNLQVIIMATNNAFNKSQWP